MSNIQDLNIAQHWHNHYWCNYMSYMKVNGSIETYVIDKLKKYSKKVGWVTVISDGLMSTNEYEASSKFCTHHINLLNRHLIEFNNEQPNIISLLCLRDIDPSPYLLLPLDDNIFENGLENILKDFKKIPFHDKKSILFWRGATSCGYPSIRTNVVERIFNYPNTDVKLIKNGVWEKNLPIDQKYFSDKCDIGFQFQFKYILIIDGACIASGLQWVFGSGSVPVIITHPKNEFWFKKYLIPMVNYVPINYDLSDIYEKVDWLVSHENECKNIMLNAKKLAEEWLTHDGQCKYIDLELNRLLNDFK